ncbi:MAG: TFIIB-type zinc ribbon-containing protein [Candidatus Nezhaarchaeota archaeon]|nr:TFIIB-type zinc ribbon-containing protein [Candidatus Nezhaarchaeota archaeon]
MVSTGRCPECGGDFKYDRQTQNYVCRSCGLTLNREDYGRIYTRKSEEDKKGDGSKKEYLKWWLGRKNE